MTSYTVHDPVTHMKIKSFRTLASAFRFAYKLLPLDGPAKYRPDGKYVTVQEWDEQVDPLRQWMISGRQHEHSA